MDSFTRKRRDRDNLSITNHKKILKLNQNHGVLSYFDTKQPSTPLKSANQIEISPQQHVTIHREKKMRINDAVHGPIEVPLLAKRIIETCQFQRLRRLKQLGMCFMYYPGATHSRFEHSVGVCHLAGRWVEYLKYKQPELDINDGDILCVQIAGLCHDLGHGPFSHVFDGMILPAAGVTNWSHEEGSVMMIDYLLNENHIRLQDYGLDDDKDLAVIKEMILGVNPETRKYRDASPDRWPRKRFLYDIVSNDESGLDVDKLDYFQRDVKHTGLDGNNCNFGELIYHSRVKQCTDGLLRICFPKDMYKTAFRAFQCRFHLHEEVYTHKVTKSYELMIRDLFVGVATEFQFAGKKFSEIIHDPKAYTYLHDSVIDFVRIFLMTQPVTPRIEKLRKLMCRIESGNCPYQYLGWIPFPEDLGKTTDEVEVEIASLMSSNDFDEMDSTFDTDVIVIGDDDKNPSSNDSEKKQELRNALVVEFMNLHHGKKSRNPLDSMYFFSADEYEDNDIRDIAQRGDMTKESLKSHSWLPSNFEDRRIRVFCKDPELCQDAMKAFKQWSTLQNTVTEIQSQQILIQ